MEHAAGPSRESDGTARPLPAGFRRAGGHGAGTPGGQGRDAGTLRRRPCVARSRPRSDRSSPFVTVEAFYSPSTGIGLPYPASDTAELIGPASAALRRIYRPGPDYAKCGVRLTGLCPAGAGQVDSFDTRDTDPHRRLMTALDAINRRVTVEAATPR